MIALIHKLVELQDYFDYFDLGIVVFAVLVTIIGAEIALEIGIVGRIISAINKVGKLTIIAKIAEKIFIEKKANNQIRKRKNETKQTSNA